MKLANKNIFVTGGTGLVGSHLVEELIKSNNTVIVLYRSLDSRSYFATQKLANKVILVQGDLKNKERMNDIISKYEIEVVFHIGAQPIVRTGQLNPYETLMSNVAGTINVLESVRLNPRVKAVVVASSDKAYGISKVLPYTEDMPLAGKDPYDCSKSCTDLIAQMYAETYNLPITVSRFGNIYGPGDLNFNRIIPGTILTGLRNETLEIRSDGTMIREYVYVKDVVSGYIALAENIEKTRGEAFNISTNQKLSVIQIVNQVSLALGREVPMNILNQCKGEIPMQYLSSEKVRLTIGWEPKYSLQQGLLETIKWYKGTYKNE